MNGEQLIRRNPERVEFVNTLAAIPISPTNAPERDHYESAGIGLIGYLQILRKHLWLILAITISCTLLTAIYMARKPDVYGAEVRVQIDLENNPGVGINGKPVVINNAASSPDYFDTQLEILRGSGLLRRVVKSLDLEHNRAFFRPEAQRTTWQKLREMAGLGYSGGSSTRQPVDQGVLMTSTVAPPTERENLEEIRRLNPYVRTIQGGLDIEQVGHTRLVEIRFTHLDPQIAAKVVNAIADAFVYVNLERMSDSNAGAASFLKKRIADLQAQIRSGEERLNNYAREHQIISLDQNQNTVVDRLNALNRQLLLAENDLNLAEAAYRAALAPGAADALSNPTQSGIEGKLGDLREKLATLKVEYTPKWPEIRVVEGQIAELEKQAAQSRTDRSDQMLKTLETKFREAKNRERTVRAAFEQQRNETIAQNNAAVNYRIIEQEIQTNQALLNGVLQRFKENDVILAGTPNNIHVTDYANTPERPIGPQRTRAVGLAFLFSLVFGVGLSLLRELSNSTVRTTGDVTRRVQLQTIAVVPKVNGWAKPGLLRSPRALLQLNQRQRGDRPLLKDDGSESRLAEVYRKLRTTVMLSKPGKSLKTLLVTSSVPAEGKTTTAVNMATVLAQTGATVLIIDADMRQPTLHEIFSLNNTRGLSTLLATDCDEAETISLIQHDEFTNLHILPAGPVPQRPSELLSSDQMRRLLSVAAAKFTHVVIDSSPVVSFTDSVLLSNLVDGVILVVQGGKCPYEIVQHSRRELDEVGAHIVGVVLNNVVITAQDSYYYYYKPSA